MTNDIIMVENLSDWQVVVVVPELSISRTWAKKGVKYPFPRETLMQMYYTPSVENLFKEGLLATNDKEFLKAVGLMTEEEEPLVYLLDENRKKRIISAMPLLEVKNELTKMSNSQLEELGDYAILNYSILNLDRVELLSKATGKNILKAVENYKASKED